MAAVTKDEAWKRLRKNYPFAVHVPDEGSSCANCKFLRGADVCANKIYRTIQGTKKLGDSADNWCCSAWTQTK